MEICNQNEIDNNTFDIVFVYEEMEEAEYTKLSKETDYSAQQSPLVQNILEVELLKNSNAKMSAYRCPFCPKKYKVKKSYEKHLEHCGKELDLQCENCAFKTNNEKSLNLHVAFKHPEIKAAQEKSNQLLSCTICSSEYQSKVLLKRHMDYCEKQSSIQCSHCPYKTKTICSLRSHIYYRHNGTESSMMSDKPKIVCPDCGKNYASKESLTFHMEKCKKPVKKLQCSLCSFKSKAKWYLSRHIFSCHINRDSFDTQIACPKCNKKYKYQTSLTNHLAICGKEPQFQCNLCSYKSFNKKYFEIHTILQHSTDDSISN